MSGLCGWAGTQTAPVEVLARMSAPLARPGALSPGGLATDTGALATGGGATAPVRVGDWLVALLGTAREGHARIDATRLAALYQSRGARDAFAAIHGEFAAALVHLRTGEAAIAVDRSGIHALAFAQLQDRFVFASHMGALDAHGELPASVSRQAIYDYFYFHMVPGPGTAFRDRSRLEPGEYAVYKDGRVERARYWRIQYRENDRRPFETLREEFRSALRQGISNQLDGRPVGAFLSGGTDSSTVAGMLGAVTGEPAHTFSIGFASEGYDETGYARLAAKHFGTKHHEYYVTPDDIVRSVPSLAARYDQPFGNSSVVPSFYCAQLARSEGIEVLLAGDGGDELFGGNERYATQHLFALYRHVPGFVRKGLLEPMASMLPAGIRTPGLRQYRRLVELCTMRMPDRMMVYNLLESLGPDKVFEAGFLAGVDRGRPLSIFRAPYDAPDVAGMLNRMLALDLKITLADNDLPKVVGACEVAGIDVRFPMLDDGVIDFSARLEPALKLKGTKLRYFFKEALRGFLPDEIITKQKHGFGLPFGPWLQSHDGLRQFVGDSLTRLRSRGIVRPAFIDELLGNTLAEHAGYYGTMVWVMLMLDQWLEHHPGARVE